MPAAPACRQFRHSAESPLPERALVFSPGRLAKSIEARGLAVFFFEDRSEKGESGLICGLNYLFWRVTGDCYHWILRDFAGKSARDARPHGRCQARPYLLRRNIVGSQMNASGAAGQSDVGTGVDQQCSSQFWVLSSQFLGLSDLLRGQATPVRGWQIFFAKLDVVDALTGRFRDFVEKANAPLGSGPGKPERSVM